jgi:hypothetical protein
MSTPSALHFLSYAGLDLVDLSGSPKMSSVSLCVSPKMSSVSLFAGGVLVVFAINVWAELVTVPDETGGDVVLSGFALIKVGTDEAVALPANGGAVALGEGVGREKPVKSFAMVGTDELFSPGEGPGGLDVSLSSDVHVQSLKY